MPRTEKDPSTICAKCGERRDHSSHRSSLAPGWHLFREPRPEGRWVAVMDTSGISYTDVTYIGVGRTEAEAREAVAAKYRAKPPKRQRFPDDVPGSEATLTATLTALDENWGIHTFGPIPDGTAVTDEEFK